MNDKSKQQLVAEVAELRQRVAELETALQEKDTRASLLLQAAPLGIHECDAKGRITFVNSSQESITGYTADELLGQNIISDITEQKRTEEELATSKAVLEATIESLPFDFFTIGPDGRYTMQNATSRMHWGNLVGNRPEDVAGDERNRSLWMSNNRRAFAGEKVEEEVELNVRGEKLFCHNIIAPITADGNIQGILGLNIDVTERTRAELALHESEERYRKVFEEGPLGIVLMGLDVRIQHVNRRFCEMLGYTFEEIAALGIDGISHPEDLKTDYEFGERLMRGDIPYYNIDKRYIRKDGTVLWGQLTVSMMHDAERKPTAVIGMIQDISERKQAEEALRKAHDELERRVEERTAELAKANKDLVLFHKLAEASAQGFGIASLNGQIVYANQAMCRLLGEAVPENVVGRHLSMYLSEEYMHKRKEEVVPQIIRDGHWQGENVITGRGGSVSVLQDSFLVQDEQGSPAYVATVTVDITDRKRIEEAVRQSRDELRAIYDGMFEGLVILDSQTKRIVRVNSSLCKMLGYTTEELLSMSIVDIHPVDESAATMARIQARADGNFREDANIRVLRKDGSVFYADIMGNTLTYGGRPSVLGLFRDVTEKRQAEEALAESEEKYRMLVETSPDAVIMTDLAGHVTYASRRTLELHGSECVDEFLGKTPLDYVVQEDHRAFHVNLKRTLDEGLVRNVEYTFLRKDGTRFPGEASGALVKDRSGKPKALIVVLRDITERKRAEEALHKEHRTLRHLLQSSDHERQLIAYEIHDGLAQQLAGAIMQFQTYVHLKDAKPKDAAKAYDAGMTMLHQGHFEARRLISGVRPPILDESGVVTAVAHLVNEERRVSGPTIEFRSKVEFNRLVPILENAIYRIVQETLTNACKHSESERVIVELEQHGDDLRIKIQDWGVGFNPDEVAENRFGLEGVRERARLLGGNTAVESALGHGSCVTVELPLVLKE